MSSIFCCPNASPYKARILDHEPKFRTFLNWGTFPKDSFITAPDLSDFTNRFVIQVVRQVNFGPLESKRYFLNTSSGEFVEVSEQWLIDNNFKKLNAFKNLKCTSHKKFFELNVYEKDAVNMHHWRADAARTASNIDL